MAVISLYSKQQRAAQSGAISYKYDEFAETLRQQILTVLENVLGRVGFMEMTAANIVWEKVEGILCQEYGVSNLPQKETYAGLISGSNLRRYFREAEVPICLDIIQVTLAVAKEVLRQKRWRQSGGISLKEAIAEINHRFKEHGVGFQIVDGQILRIDSGLTFQQATLPALTLLRQPYLVGANQEFLAAHDHFRHGRYKECLNECLKAFESTMKAICHKRKWPYNQNDTAKTLIKACEDNGLFPVFMSNHLTGLRMTLESGVPTARNKTSGHGQGVTPIVVSEDFASYVLNLTASNVLFLANSEKNLK